MDKKTKIMTVLAVLLVLGVGTVLISNSRKSSTKTSSNSSTAGSQNKSTATPTPAPTENGNAVTIKDYSFGPKNIIVKEGTTITWTNQDSIRHTVTADTASADAPKSELFGKGETYTFTFKKAGTYTYHCEPHPYMKGTITVTKETRSF